MKAIIYFTCWLLIFQAVFAQKPLPNAHAHNDYVHKIPLQEALSQGFTSVEADIWLINNDLYVSHNLPKKVQGITLKDLYFKPLQKRLQENGNRIYKNYEGVFFLMIDIKAKGEEVFKVLQKQILEIPEFQANPYFKIFLSGNRPFETVKNDSKKLVGIDGRPEDLGKNYSPDFMPVISETYHKFCKWNGTGQMPESEFIIVKSLAEKTHAEGKKLRLWAIPDNENSWKTLAKAGVDLINTDKLEELADFLKKYNPVVFPVVKNNFIVISHRGNHENAPENTIESLKNAISVGVDFVEIDIRTTKDNALVIMHDGTVDRTTNGTGKVSEMTLQEFKALAPQPPKGESNDSQKKNILNANQQTPPSGVGGLPTFEEILQEAQGKVNLYLDAKECEPKIVVELLKKYKMENAVVVYTEVSEIQQWKAAAPTIPVMVSPPKNIMQLSDLEKFISENQIDILDGSVLFYTKGKVDFLKEKGIPVWADIQNPNENPEQWQKAINLGINALQTDHPTQLILFLKNNNKR